MSVIKMELTPLLQFTHLVCDHVLCFSAFPLGIWDRVVQSVAKLREESAMLKLFTDHVKGEDMYGLTVHAVLRITESVRSPFPKSESPFGFSLLCSHCFHDTKACVSNCPFSALLCTTALVKRSAPQRE